MRRTPIPTGSPAAALLAAMLALAACARQAPPPPAEPPPRPVVRRAPPAPARPAARPDPAQAERDRQAQAACAYQAGIVEDRMEDRGAASLGFDGALAGQSARDACLRRYRETGGVPALP